MLIATATAALILWIFPDDVRTCPIREWPAAGLAPYSSKTMTLTVDQLLGAVRPATTLVISNAALAASAEEVGYVVLSPYSPELDFLFDRSLRPEEIHDHLARLGVEAVVFEAADTPETQYLRQFPFFSLRMPGLLPVDRMDQNFVLFRVAR